MRPSDDVQVPQGSRALVEGMEAGRPKFHQVTVIADFKFAPDDRKRAQTAAIRVKQWFCS
jgi:hypothetical protein